MEINFWASGRRERSAMRTLQFRERSRAAKERFMPEDGELVFSVEWVVE